MTADSIQQIMH